LWHIKITPSDASSSVILRLESSVLTNGHWKWLVALSNSAYGVECTTSLRADAITPPLLACLTRGQFMQALQSFRVRSLYASVYHDLQVPYSCGAIRAYNPYRHASVSTATSLHYKHITIHSLYNATLVRDTLPVVQRGSPKSLFTQSSKDQSQQEQSNDGVRVGRAWSEQRSLVTKLFRKHSRNRLRMQRAMSVSSNTKYPNDVNQEEGVDDRIHPSTSSSRAAKAPLAYSTSFQSDPPSRARSPPFAEGSHLLIDRLEDAFTTDPQSTLLRGMLLSLQSIGWRRLDVMMENIMVHEKIIAKRANGKHDPLDGGLDIVHHVMDTFLV
jgi:hypothetical protein